jgi:hypothetical protein
MISYLAHYCRSHIEDDPEMLKLFTAPFKQNSPFKEKSIRSSHVALKALDTCLNGWYFDNPAQEPLPKMRPPQPPNLKLWARITASALDFGRIIMDMDKQKEQTDMALSHIFCHWDNLLRGLMELKLDGYDEDQRTNDIIEICDILKTPFSTRIRDSFNDLSNSGKHAVILQI